jgi:caa(3)-type oxidase subunit IV
MTVHTPESIAREERRYFQVFFWLFILTVLEIGATYMPISRVIVGVVLVVLAATKASMVALFYMHLVHETRTLAYIALTPAVLCAFLVFMLLPDLGAVTRLIETAVAAAPAVH